MREASYLANATGAGDEAPPAPNAEVRPACACQTRAYTLTHVCPSSSRVEAWVSKPKPPQDVLRLAYGGPWYDIEVSCTEGAGGRGRGVYMREPHESVKPQTYRVTVTPKLPEVRSPSRPHMRHLAHPPSVVARSPHPALRTETHPPAAPPARSRADGFVT
jgi:hypothetical protein